MVGEIERIIDALEAARVRYLIVGSVAIVLDLEDVEALERLRARGA
jgi:hypothetical protein